MVHREKILSSVVPLALVLLEWVHLPRKGIINETVMHDATVTFTANMMLEAFKYPSLAGMAPANDARMTVVLPFICGNERISVVNDIAAMY